MLALTVLFLFIWCDSKCIVQFQNCGYPVYWKGVVFSAAAGDKSETLSLNQFSEFWRRLMTSHHDEASQFVFVLSKGGLGKRSLVPEDFVPLIQDIVDTHPGLGFLKEATEFHSRYVHTVSPFQLHTEGTWPFFLVTNRLFLTQRTLTYFVRGKVSLFLQLTSKLSGLGSAGLLMINQQQIYLFG